MSACPPVRRVQPNCPFPSGQFITARLLSAVVVGSPRWSPPEGCAGRHILLGEDRQPAGISAEAVMGLMDKVRAQSTQLAQMAQETAREGKVKLDQAQAKRRADAMFRDLGATVYAERTGRGTPDSKGKIDRLVDALSRQEASQGLGDPDGSTPPGGSPSEGPPPEGKPPESTPPEGSSAGGSSAGGTSPGDAPPAS